MNSIINRATKLAVFFSCITVANKADQYTQSGFLHLALLFTSITLASFFLLSLIDDRIKEWERKVVKVVRRELDES